MRRGKEWERAIQELGYVPNPNARIRKKENKSLGVIIAIEDQPYNTYEFNYETGLYSYNITNGIPIDWPIRIMGFNRAVLC